MCSPLVPASLSLFVAQALCSPLAMAEQTGKISVTVCCERHGLDTLQRRNGPRVRFHTARPLPRLCKAMVNLRISICMTPTRLKKPWRLRMPAWQKSRLRCEGEFSDDEEPEPDNRYVFSWARWIARPRLSLKWMNGSRRICGCRRHAAVHDDVHRKKQWRACGTRHALYWQQQRARYQG